jgi:membrane protease subunit HflK
MAQRPFDPRDFEYRDYRQEWRFLWERFRRWLTSASWIVVVIIVGLYALSGFYTVGPSEVGLVKRFGKFVRTSDPGFHYRLPYPIESVVVVNVRQPRTEEIGFRSVPGLPSAQFPEEREEALMLTADGNIVHVEVIVQYDIKEPERFAFNLSDPERIVDQASKAAIREKVALRTVDQTLTTERDVIAEETRETLQKLLDTYEAGIRVINVRLQEVTPPTTEVNRAFDDVNSALQDKERKINDAQKYSNDLLPRAQGESQQILNIAEAYKQSRILQAQGDVARFVAILERYELGRDVTELRLYLEALETVLPKLNKVIVTKGTTGVLGVLNLDEVLKTEGGR